MIVTHLIIQQVTFSESFLQSFRRLNSAQTKNLVICLLLKLASGWRPKKRSVNLFCESSSHIVKHFQVENLHVICSVDIAKEQQYMQVLKVWELLPWEDISKFVKHLDDNIFVKYTDDFVIRCKEKCLDRYVFVNHAVFLVYSIKNVSNMN